MPGISSRLPKDIEVLGVSLPGRESLSRLPMNHGDDVDRTLTILTEQLGRLTPAPSVWFGHSLGGALALALAARVDPRPHRLVISAYPPGGRSLWSAADADDHQLGELMTSSGAPDQLMQILPWRNHATAILRADLRFGREIADAARDGAVLTDVRIDYVGAREDLVVPGEAMRGWLDERSDGTSFQLVRGDHGYVVRDVVDEVLIDLLSQP